MTPENFVTKRLVLPDLKLIDVKKVSNKTFHYHCIKKTEWEICRKCPTKSYDVHDRRTVKVKDSKIRNKNIKLFIRKRRFRCPNCKAVFTELIDGIKFKHRTTERYKDEILYDSKHYSNLKNVAKKNRCSTGFVSKICYDRLDIELRKKNNTPWSKTLCIDEHAFKKEKGKARKTLVTSFVDNKRKVVRELAPSMNHIDLKKAIEHIPGKEKVTHVCIDLTDSFKNFIIDYFPNAKIVADKFHVLRLIHPSLRKYRQEVTGDDRKNPIRHLLLKKSKRLTGYEKKALNRFCKENPKVNEVYRFKERIMGFYRIKGFKQAKRIFIKITDEMAKSDIPEIKTLRKTFLKWNKEVLRYFSTGLTNARVEGFNRKCKLIQKKAFGYRSFKNYRLRVLYDC